MSDFPALSGVYAPPDQSHGVHELPLNRRGYPTIAFVVHQCDERNNKLQGGFEGKQSQPQELKVSRNGCIPLTRGLKGRIRHTSDPRNGPG